jgi:hypothetical protein
MHKRRQLFTSCWSGCWSSFQSLRGFLSLRGFQSLRGLHTSGYRDHVRRTSDCRGRDRDRHTSCRRFRTSFRRFHVRRTSRGHDVLLSVRRVLLLSGHHVDHLRGATIPPCDESRDAYAQRYEPDNDERER